jgi:hypothetical protein
VPTPAPPTPAPTPVPTPAPTPAPTPRPSLRQLGVDSPFCVNAGTLSHGPCDNNARKRAATGAQRLLFSVAIDFIRESHHAQCVPKMVVFVDNTRVAEAQSDDLNSKIGTVRAQFVVDLLDGEHRVTATLKKLERCLVLNKAVSVDITSLADITPAQAQKLIAQKSSSSESSSSSSSSSSSD